MKIIKYNFSQDFIAALSQNMNETIYTANEVLIKPFAKDLHMPTAENNVIPHLYFIKQGHIQVFLKENFSENTNRLEKPIKDYV